MKIKFKSSDSMRGYNGRDGDNRFSLADGQSIEISEAKAAQLLADFPKNFKSEGPGHVTDSPNSTGPTASKSKGPFKNPAKKNRKPPTKGGG